MDLLRTESQTNEAQGGEEPEYVSRYTAVKHSWRGRYKRIMCISSSAIITQDPGTLAATNRYDLVTEFDGVTPSPGKDETLDFSLSVRAGERGKFKPIKFSCRNRAGLLTDIYRVLETLRLEKQVVPSPMDFPVLHLKRKSGEWVPLIMRVTVTGIETLHESSGTLHWSVAFKDLASPALVVFADPYGRGGGQGGGFVLRPAYGRSKKAFTATQGSTLSSLLTKITTVARQYIGITLVVDNTQKLTVQNFVKERATAAVGAEETPLGEWSVVRLRSAGKGTASTVGSVAGTIAPRQAGSGGSDMAVLRQLVLTRTSLVERRPDNYEAVIVRPLSSVNALVRFAEEPQMLAIEFNDGCPTHVYSSTSRDSLLACVLDAIQTDGSRPLQVLPRPTLPGHRIDPPCNPASVASAGKAGDMEVADGSHLKHLSQAAKECLAENGASPAAKSKLWRRVREFNANIPYSGLASNADVPEAALMALLSMLPAPTNTAPGAPPAPPPSAKAATAVIGILACVRRLLGSVGATSTVVGITGAVVRVMGQLRSGSEGVSAEAAGLIAMLVGGGPGEGGTPGRERAALLQNAKQALLANAGQITILVSRLRPITVSSLLSLQVVGVLEAMLCEPHSESTDDRTFHEMLRQVANLRRRLFALFAHPAAGVFETVALIMRTIAEEDGVAAEPMRDAALKDGALLRHLVHALFLPPGERREVSRQLVALWADAHEPALELLARCLPPGLVAYLYTRPSDDDIGDITTFAGAHWRRLLQRRRGRAPVKPTEPQTPPLQALPPPAYAADSLVAPSAVATIPTENQGQNSQTLGQGPQTLGQRPLTPDGQAPSQQIVPASSPGGSESIAIVPHSNGAVHTTETEQTIRPPPAYSQVVSSPSSSPAPVAIPTASPTPPGQALGAGKMRCNWMEFWRQFERDHSRADLIWNERTRQELKEALDSEVHSLELERDRAIVEEDVGASTAEEEKAEVGEKEDGSEETGGGQLSWNYAEFRVKYASLAKEVCVGEYYLRLLLESSAHRDSQPFPLRDPPSFFRALYHRFLCDADTGLSIEGVDESSQSLPWEDFCDVNGLDGFGGSGGVGGLTRELCARAMALVYEQHKERIGPFDGTAHVTVLLDRTNDRALRHRLLLLLQALVKVPSNARACVAVGGVELAVDLLASAHEAAERAVTPSQNNLIAASAHVDPPKEWYYQGKDGSKEGPVEKDQVRRLWSKGDIDFSTKCWAEGMGDWKPLRAIRELRWAMAKKTAVLTPVQAGEVALTILHDLVSLHSSVDDYGELVTPAPVVKRILSSPRCLPHLAQGVLTGEPRIVEMAASLMEVITTYNPPAMARLYASGAFYFALAYGGANLRTISSLFKKAHLHQAFHGGADAAVASALPLAKRSVLGGLLPESLLYVLEKSGAQAFAAAMVADSDTPEIIWTHKMRSERLIHQVQQHLGDYPSKLPQHCHSLYEYAPMPPVTYPELEDEMWCHRYYLRNLCDESRFPDWPIVEHVEFLQSLLAMWREELTRRPLELSEEQACEILEIALDDVRDMSAASSPAMSPEKDGAEGGRREKRKGRVDEEVLKRQYKKMAMKFHPDKNPEGRDQFVAVQAAYERLQASLAGGLQGPQSWRLRLLLKAQCILFRRYGQVLEPFKYAGYPMLLNAITLEDSDPAFLSSERAPLLEAATELIWLTCVSSALNGEELVRDGGVQLLATLLGRCMPLVRAQTPPTEPAAVIVTNIMRTMAGLATFESAQREMMSCIGLIPDIVHCTELERSTISIDSALQTMGQLCVDSAFQEWLLSAGVLWFLLPLLLQYDATAEKKETGGPQGIGASVQGAKNLHAMLATRALAKLGGFMEGELSTPHNQEATAVLRGLLTPRVATQLKDRSPRELLRNLTSNLETPHVIWNSVTRSELLRFVDQQKAHKGPDGKYTLTEATAFKYKALSKELQVGDVYLRIFNQQPDFKVDNIDAFCDALLEYISEAVKRRRELATPPSQKKAPPKASTIAETPAKTSRKTSLFEKPVKKSLFEDEKEAAENRTADGGETSGSNAPFAAENKHEGGALTSTEETVDTASEAQDSSQLAEETAGVNDKEDAPQKEAKAEKSEAQKLVEHLAMALQALLNVLTSDPHLAAVFSTRPQLAPLLGCLMDTSAESGKVPELALAVLTRLTAHAPCVEAMVADRGGLLLLFQLLHTAPHLRPSVLHVLSALASTTDAAWAAAKNGGAIFILEVLLPAGQAVPATERAAAASLLGKVVAQPLHGPRVSIALGKFLPDGLVATIVDGPGEAVVSALGRTTETPELVWSPAMAASLAQQLATLGQELIKEQAGGGADWEMPDWMGKRGSPTGEIILQDGAVDEPQVGGVYVRLFLKDPKFPLRNRKRFLEGLLDQYVATSATVRSGSGDPELPLLFSAALVSLLRVHPILADHVAHLGYINKLVGTMAAEGRRASMADSPQEEASQSSSDGPTPQERVRASCLRILHQLATSTACAEAMAAPNAGAPQVVPLLMRAVGWHGASVLALETLKRLVTANNRARDALVGQGLRTGLVPVLLALLDWRAGAKNGLSSQMKWNEAEASVGRVLAVEVLRLLAAEGVHSLQVKEILDKSEIWRAYKDQKHDLFLPSSASSATGVAGLIEGPSSAAQFALPAPQSKVYLPDKTTPPKKPVPGGAPSSSSTPPMAKDSTPLFQDHMAGSVGPSTPGTPLPVSTTPLREQTTTFDTGKLGESKLKTHDWSPEEVDMVQGSKADGSMIRGEEKDRGVQLHMEGRGREAGPLLGISREVVVGSAGSIADLHHKPIFDPPEDVAPESISGLGAEEGPQVMSTGVIAVDEEEGAEFGGDSGEAERQLFDGPPPL